MSKSIKGCADINKTQVHHMGTADYANVIEPTAFLQIKLEPNDDNEEADVHNGSYDDYNNESGESTESSIYETSEWNGMQRVVNIERITDRIHPTNSRETCEDYIVIDGGEVGGGKKKTREPHWTHDETMKLIDLWREHYPQLRGFGPKKELFLKIENELKEHGVTRASVQIQNRLRNLRMKYAAEKQCPTGSSPSSWPYYQAIHQIVASSSSSQQPVSSDPGLVEESREASSTVETSAPSPISIEPVDPQTPNDSALASETTPTQGILTYRQNRKRGKKRKSLEEERADREAKIFAAIEDIKQQRIASQETFDRRWDRFEQILDQLASRVGELVDVVKTVHQPDGPYKQ